MTNAFPIFCRISQDECPQAADTGVYYREIIVRWRIGGNCIYCTDFIFLFKGIKAFLIKPLEFIGTHILDFDDNRVFTLYVATVASPEIFDYSIDNWQFLVTASY